MNPMTLPVRPATADAAFDRRLDRVMRSVDLHHTLLLGYLRGLTRHRQDAEDLAQELWRYVLLRFKEEQIGCLPLLRHKAYQLFVDHYRTRLRRRETLTDTLTEQAAVVVREQRFSATEEAALQERFWSEYPGLDLTAQQKEVLWLHARYGLTYKEIEARLGIAASTIGDWIAVGRARLGAALEAQQNPQQRKSP
jgi:RNA polymerase sigma factor (sigma-70 family)